MKRTSTAFKAIVAAVLLTSFIAVGCGDNKKEEKTEPAKTEEAAPAPAPAPADDDTAKPGPVTPVN